MKKIRICGVPEHFNLPWQLAIEMGTFEAEGIDLEWTNVPEGTGKIAQMLLNGETDMAVILTEGVIREILNGNPCKIVQQYVESPLLWGVHVAAKSSYKSLADLDGQTVAISREGSGSQLMAHVNAANNNYKKKLSFEIVNTIEGAVEALQNDSSQYFMWEHFMTKPLVDNGTLGRLDDCPTPWPSFVIAANDESVKHQKQTIARILELINETTLEFKDIPSIDRTLSSRFLLKIEDVNEWLELTEWSQENFSEKLLNKVQSQLLAFGIIDKKGTFDEIVKIL